MQKIIVISACGSWNLNGNLNELKNALSDGWKVVSSENILSSGNEAPYTSSIIYIVEKQDYNMKKEVQLRTEDCWDCGGTGHDYSYSNSSSDCRTCKKTGKLPKGSWDWEKRRRDAEKLM